MSEARRKIISCNRDHAVEYTLTLGSNIVSKNITTVNTNYPNENISFIQNRSWPWIVKSVKHTSWQPETGTSEDVRFVLGCTKNTHGCSETHTGVRTCQKHA